MKDNSMYQQRSQLSDTGSRKRDRDSDDESPQGFSEHRTKRPYIANLPLRYSPELRRSFHPPQRSPSVADITPAGSDSEDNDLISAPAYEPRSFFSPWSSPPAPSDPNLPSSQVSPSPAFFHSSTVPDALIYSDDMDMGETTPSFTHNHSNTSTFGYSNMLTIGALQPDSQAQASSLSGRIPTPIHCQFSNHIRHDSIGSPSESENYSYSRNNHSAPDRRRLPSPISEGDASSPSPRYSLQTHKRSRSTLSTLSDADMGMEIYVTQPLQDLSVRPDLALHQDLSAPMQVEQQSQEDVKTSTSTSPMKKGHSRNKYSIRAGWGSSFSGEMGPGGTGLRRGFSMGYRSDCEKCRMKVPGHFSHVITY